MRALAGTLFLVQVATGLLLMCVYSPSTATAWGSVFHVQTSIAGGWFIRGLHHFSSDALLMTLVLYGLELAWRRGGLSANRNVWLCVLGAGFAALALSLTGHLLPWDQHGYWGTHVRGNILARTPLVGESLRRMMLGGTELGNLALARFHAVHVVVLPAMLAALLWRCAGRAPRPNAGLDQESADAGGDSIVERDRLIRAGYSLLAVAAIAGVVGYLCGTRGWTLLDGPADPMSADYPARPEWHTVFLYQWLKYFHGPTAEAVAAVVVPGGITLLLFLLPWVERALPAKAASAANRGFVGLLLTSIITLSVAAYFEDRRPTVAEVAEARAVGSAGGTLPASAERVLRAEGFHRAREWAEKSARRAMELAAEGVAPEGPIALVRSDWRLQGPTLFARHCASCHRFDGHDGRGFVSIEPQASSDLAGYGGEAWIRGFLRDPLAEKYFGRMLTPQGKPAHTRMAKYLRELREGLPDDAAARQMEADLGAAAAYLADEGAHPGRLAAPPSGSDDGAAPPDGVAKGQAFDDSLREALSRKGREVFVTQCNECHSYRGERSGTFRAPEMFGYGSVEWIELMIAEPGHEDRYGSSGKEPARMPPFADRLTPDERRMIAQWLAASRGTAQGG